MGDLWVIVTALYHGMPAWKQVPLTLDQDAAIPKSFESEVGETARLVMKALAKELDEEATKKNLEFLIASNSLERMIRQGVIEFEAVKGEDSSMHLEGQLWEELASRLTPRVAQGMVDGIRQSLSVQFETLPFSLEAPGHRGEKMITVQDTFPDPNSKPRPFSGPKMIARSVVGRAIWHPSVIPFVVPKPWIGNLFEARSHLSFTKVNLIQEAEEVCRLTPEPWARHDLINPMVHPVVTFPLALIGCPPDPGKILEAATHYQEGSQARSVLNLMGENPDKQEWFSLVDFLEAKEEVPQTPGRRTSGGGDEQP